MPELLNVGRVVRMRCCLIDSQLCLLVKSSKRMRMVLFCFKFVSPLLSSAFTGVVCLQARCFPKWQFNSLSVGDWMGVPESVVADIPYLIHTKLGSDLQCIL